MGIVTLILGLSCASFSPKHDIPTAYESNSMKWPTSDSTALIRSIPLDEATRMLLNQIIQEPDAEDLKYQCLLLELIGVREAKGQAIAVRIFLNLPGADEETSYEMPNFVTSFTLADSAPETPRDLIFNLKPTILRLGEGLLEDIDNGRLTLAFVPFHFRAEKEVKKSAIQFRTEALKLVVDCE
ncbi:MAG: hypothetical protein KTR30_08580 [Saprospiraceae bacterium]|nr:hypothetical protein [Saprospiraceae bacterium]